MTRIRLKIRIQMHGLSFPLLPVVCVVNAAPLVFLAPVRKQGVNPVAVQLPNIVLRNQITTTCLADRIKG